MTAEPSGTFLIYQRDDGSPDIDIRFDGDTAWATQAQIAELFHSSKANISEHISNIFAEGELNKEATVREYRTVRQEGARSVERSLTYYNLDMILSVGYRVKSKEATQFRIWATDRLRDYLVKGYAINQERIDQLGSIIQILARSEHELVAGMADVVAEYIPGLTLLRDFDEGKINTEPSRQPNWTLTIDEARRVLQRVAPEFPSDSLLGQERGDALDGIIAAIYQTFDGEDLYKTVEEKAANLLYLVIKDHPLSDGNKRSAAALFVTFLARNDSLYDKDGKPRISSNALAATTLMVAMSNPTEKDLMIALLVRMIVGDQE